MQTENFIPQITCTHLEKKQNETGSGNLVEENDQFIDEELSDDNAPSFSKKIPTFREVIKEMEPFGHQNSMDLFLKRQKFKHRKASSFDKTSKLTKNTEITSESISKVIEENLKLEEQIEQMQKFSEENEILRKQLSNAKSKITEQEQKIIHGELNFNSLEKDQRITELSLTLSEREDKYKRLLKDFEELKSQVDKETSVESGLQKMIEEKEEELEKINYMNASYRAQLIELKLSMAKTREATMSKKEHEQYVVKINSPEEALEEAKENIIFKEAKIQEQNSIIETLIAQVKYYEQKKK